MKYVARYKRDDVTDRTTRLDFEKGDVSSSVYMQCDNFIKSACQQDHDTS